MKVGSSIMKVPSSSASSHRPPGTPSRPRISIPSTFSSAIEISLLQDLVASFSPLDLDHGKFRIVQANSKHRSVLWGILGPKVLFGSGSQYSWLYYAFFVGPAVVFLTWLVHKWKPQWKLEERFNPVLIFSGGNLFPVYQTANLLTSSALSAFL